jgi:hypothetical protein
LGPWMSFSSSATFSSPTPATGLFSRAQKAAGVTAGPARRRRSGPIGFPPVYAAWQGYWVLLVCYGCRVPVRSFLGPSRCSCEEEPGRWQYNQRPRCATRRRSAGPIGPGNCSGRIGMTAWTILARFVGRSHFFLTVGCGECVICGWGEENDLFGRPRGYARGVP